MAQSLTSTPLPEAGQSSSLHEGVVEGGVNQMVENVVSLHDGVVSDKRFDNFDGTNKRVDADCLSCGRRLRHRRHEINADAEQIAKQLRLPVAYLDAIEAGRWEQLPGRSFAICYIRDYAELLGLDADDLASCAKSEIAPVNANSVFRFPKPMYGSEGTGGVAVFLSALVIGSVIAAVLYL